MKIVIETDDGESEISDINISFQYKDGRTTASVVGNTRDKSNPYRSDASSGNNEQPVIRDRFSGVNENTYSGTSSASDTPVVIPEVPSTEGREVQVCAEMTEQF